MPYLNVALCGSTGVGKATILDRYAQATGARIEREIVAGHSVSHLLLAAHGVHLHTAADMMTEPERILPALLADADEVLYVVTPETSLRRRLVAELEVFHAIAAPIGRDWPDTPWQLCLNRMDCGHDFLILEHFPRAVRSHCICTYAHRGDGLDTLFDQLLGPTAA